MLTWTARAPAGPYPLSVEQGFLVALDDGDRAIAPELSRWSVRASVVFPAPGELVTLRGQDGPLGQPRAVVLGDEVVLRQHLLLQGNGFGRSGFGMNMGVVVVVCVIVRMVVLLIAGQGDHRRVFAASARCAHISSLPSKGSSVPGLRATSTSALPQGHNRIGSRQLELVGAACGNGRCRAAR